MMRARKSLAPQPSRKDIVQMQIAEARGWIGPKCSRTLPTVEQHVAALGLENQIGLHYSHPRLVGHHHEPVAVDCPRERVKNGILHRRATVLSIRPAPAGKVQLQSGLPAWACNLANTNVPDRIGRVLKVGAVILNRPG